MEDRISIRSDWRGPEWMIMKILISKPNTTWIGIIVIEFFAMFYRVVLGHRLGVSLRKLVGQIVHFW